MAQDWWKGVVIYQIYPRSFQDDDGDGMGDLKGITRRLPHVADLGAEAIWLSPVFTSPMADMGYDVSDYRDIDPTFGTLAEFDALVARAHQLGLKVIIDQVLSHSSDRHPFFQESRLTRDNPKADWYVWADAKPEGSPPNNWQAIFGGPAWSWDVRRRQYYYHQFLPQQPDLNFHNPEVRAWALETLDFWLDRGVDGFRLDAMNHLFHDAQLRDNPPDIRPKSGPDYKPFEMQYPIHSKNRPETVAFTEVMRAHVEKRGPIALLAELGGDHHTSEQLTEYTAPGRLHLAYTNDLMTPAFSAAKVRRSVEGVAQGNPCWSFSNHDVPRHVGRWSGHAVDQDSFAKLTATLLLTLPGAVSLYQGEELGLTNTELSYEELVDPEGLTFWPDNPGRDGCRTPMPWENGAVHGGFSMAETTWLPLRRDHAARAVDVQAGDPDSVLEHYRAVLAYRRKSEALRTGGTEFLDTGEPALAFRRGGTHLCAFNLGTEPVTIDTGSPAKAEIASDGVEVAGTTVTLPGNGFLIAV
ncbi:DUF3459 domain-containing protein [Rhodobacterales bacterium HKCCE3408]|nr:DUF3459 domain-containing protein [Rhodobacterales bacterium HKCCE3408]